MSSLWSEKLAAHYGLRLPPDLRAWIDDGLWREAGGAEFHLPQSPEHLIEPNGAIWGGFMPPDTLPIISNDNGDWLSLRVGVDGSVLEVLYWGHGGGDWIPYGRTLSAALLYDAAIHLPSASETTLRFVPWAAAQLQAAGHSVRPFWTDHKLDPLEELIAAGVAQEAAHRDLSLRALNWELHENGTPQTARAMNVPWEPDFVRWQFDAALVPAAQRAKLAQLFDKKFDSLASQNWDSAEKHALQVCRHRHDLGWAAEIAGWAAERRGDVPAAIDLYASGLAAPVYSDQAVRFRTQWFPPGYGKFAAFRLAELQPHLPPSLRDDPYLSIFLAGDATTLKERVYQHWLSLADAATARADHRTAYQMLLMAGWDCGLPMLSDYADLLKRLEQAAVHGQSPALAQLAKAHRRSLL